MESSWDDDNFEPEAALKPVNANKWEGEDEDDDVKESWEDEDEEQKVAEEKKEMTPPLAQTQKNKKKTLADKIAEKEKARVQEIERKKKELDDEEEEEEEDISPEEKMRRQQESDLDFALDTTFKSDLDNMTPTTKEEFDEFANIFLKKMKPLVTTAEFPGFAENLIRNLCASLTSYDLKKIKTTIDNLVLEKQKIEKGDKAKKSKGKGKAKLKIDNENQYSAYVDDFDEYDDFM